MRATCVCRVSAMIKCPVWGRFGNSPRRTPRPRNWAVDCSPCPFGSSISLLWEQEGKCHSAVVQSYRKDKSGVTLPEMLRTSPLQKKKLEQYSFMSSVCFQKVILLCKGDTDVSIAKVSKQPSERLACCRLCFCKGCMCVCVCLCVRVYVTACVCVCV